MSKQTVGEIKNDLEEDDLDSSILDSAIKEALDDLKNGRVHSHEEVCKLFGIK
ncbi:MAG: hypothetical protein G01um101418_200 [Parcubacteria group bacterium Gr01-1014_18]|nr:MAG: hypothetical protein Greene041636_168 [Parcubacteria group bacterium Greene0416_36]TSC81360.1 MAG: hypothetical protein G01um101418_200 [Parcubacteria group bacterium Gr01-1014_18]TSC99454.1 MAG: hypothetical protein Greene101420_121 [Parcubacteria group bacterium Greene1014_20]TSD07627.1 MAG: hypothetical protein Greene07142_84 [Parcubacteria group bacterium Greene0714_2]